MKKHPIGYVWYTNATKMIASVQKRMLFIASTPCHWVTNFQFFANALCSLHALNEAFQTINSLLIDLDEISGQLVGQQQLSEQDGAMFQQKLFAPSAPEANVFDIR